MLRAILDGTAGEIGQRFFARLVQNLARALGTYGAWVTEYLEHRCRLRALAFWLDAQWVSDYEYDVVGTPCEPVVENRSLVHIPERVVELYPLDPDLQNVGAVSYLGVPLLALDGKVLGHLAVLDTKPMPEDPHLLAVFQIAARAAAELRRLRAESALHERDERLQSLIDEAASLRAELAALQGSGAILGHSEPLQHAAGHPPGGRNGRHCLDPRRDWYGQGTRGARSARCQLPATALL